MAENNPNEKPATGAGEAPKKPKKEKVPVDPSQRGPKGLTRDQLRGKSAIFRKTKKSGR